IEIHNKHNTKLIYTYSKYNDNKPLLEHLKKLLIDNGIQLTPKPSEDVLEKLSKIQDNKYANAPFSGILDILTIQHLVCYL
ncbi:MAG: hypothetical protein II200_05640, partial [Bacteroidaceae bacterium]|nr:hypothetical protein [Bacteroidaceae bacterium]